MPFKSGLIPYAACLFEGEGTVGAYFGTYLSRGHGPRRPRLTRQWQLAISMTDREPLDRFMDVFGFGAVDGPYVDSRHPAYKPYYRYGVSGFEKTQAIIAAMWSWLSPRRKEQWRVTLS